MECVGPYEVVNLECDEMSMIGWNIIRIFINTQ